MFIKRDPNKTKSYEWQPGDTITGQYEILNVLKGGMGTVYICRYRPALNPKKFGLCALKTFQGEQFNSIQARHLFEKEALVWVELGKYPNIVEAYGVVRLKKRLFISLEYVDPDEKGRNTLTHYLGNLSFTEILRLSIQFCHGMEYVYSMGVDAHRDIKPDNIMITPDKTVKITDFGLVKAFQEISAEANPYSVTADSNLSIFKSREGKLVCGTLPYMPPEQFDGYADKRSDIYSFGIVLYQMLAKGKYPFISKSQEEFEELHRFGKISPVSSPLFSIVEKCLEKSPDKRFQSFSAIKNELQNFYLKETGETLTAPPTKDINSTDLVYKGASFYYLGLWHEMLSSSEEAIKINPKDSWAWYHKGLALSYFAKYKDEFLCYLKALSINPILCKAWRNLPLAFFCMLIRFQPYAFRAWQLCQAGNRLFNSGKYEQALTYYNEIIRINPGSAAAWYNKGSALSNLGRYEEADACLKEATWLNKKFTVAWFNRGFVLYKIGRYREAINCYDKTIGIKRKYAEAWYNKALAEENINDIEAAMNSWKKYLEYARHNPQQEQWISQARANLEELERKND